MPQALSSPPRDEHIAACGLFCTNCGRFKKGKCEGCQVSPAFANCPARSCCMEKGIITCAECPDFTTIEEYRSCKKLNSFVAKVFSFIFRTDRPTAIHFLRDSGKDAYLAEKRSSGKM